MKAVTVPGPGFSSGAEAKQKPATESPASTLPHEKNAINVAVGNSGRKTEKHNKWFWAQRVLSEGNIGFSSK